MQFNNILFHTILTNLNSIESNPDFRDLLYPNELFMHSFSTILSIWLMFESKNNFRQEIIKYKIKKNLTKYTRYELILVSIFKNINSDQDFEQKILKLKKNSEFILLILTLLYHYYQDIHKIMIEIDFRLNRVDIEYLYFLDRFSELFDTICWIVDKLQIYIETLLNTYFYKSRCLEIYHLNDLLPIVQKHGYQKKIYNQDIIMYALKPHRILNTGFITTLDKFKL